MKNWVGGENLKGAGKRERVIRIYFMKIINERETEGGEGRGKRRVREWGGTRVGAEADRIVWRQRN